MIPFVAPPVWPVVRPGRFAHTILPHTPELFADPAARDHIAKCRVAIIGIPDDTGVRLNHGRPGAAQGPHAFRSALSTYGVASPIDLPGHAAYPRVFDVGDVIPGSSLSETHDRVSAATAAVLELGLFPIAIGGGHDLTFPFVRTVAKHSSPLSQIYFDAHLDVRPEPGSGMPFRALLDSGFIRSPLVVGLNPLVNSQEHADYFRAHRGTIIPRAAFTPDSVLSLLAHTPAPIACSLDMDVFDASHAPGVSALNPDGLSPRDIAPLLSAIAASGKLRCFDIMELNPAHDSDHRTARLAAHMFLSLLRELPQGPTS